jgi:hypothetical protein
MTCVPVSCALDVGRVDQPVLDALRTGAQSGAGFDSSGYGIHDDEDVADGGPAEGEGSAQRRQILDAALKHVVRCCGFMRDEAQGSSAARSLLSCRVADCRGRLTRVRPCTEAQACSAA